MKLSLLSLVFLASGLQAAQVSMPSATEMALAGAKPTQPGMGRNALPTTMSEWLQEGRDCCALFMQAVALPKEYRQAALACFKDADGSVLAAYLARVQAQKKQ